MQLFGLSTIESRCPEALLKTMVEPVKNDEVRVPLTGRLGASWLQIRGGVVRQSGAPRKIGVSSS